MKTAYRATGKPMGFLDMVRRLSTVTREGKVQYSKPSFRIIDERQWDAAVDPVNHVFREDTEVDRFVSLLMHDETEGSGGWRKVASVSTYDHDETDDATEGQEIFEDMAYDLFFENTLSLAEANLIVRTLDWEWTP